MNILLVDDHLEMVETLAQTLAACMEDVSCFTAANGEAAVQILKSRVIDLIMTDLNMPVMDGYDLIEYRNRRYPYIPLIAVTADASPGTMRKLDELGIAECLEKPFSFEAVMKVFRDKLGGGPCEPSCSNQSGLYGRLSGVPAREGHRRG